MTLSLLDMKINLNKEKQLISKKAILNYCTDIDVYRLYINEDIEINKVRLSPLRKENTPSFGFFIGETAEVCFKDHLLGGGDFVRFVQMKFGLTYFEALSQIATDLGIQNDYICKQMNKINNEKLTSEYLSREQILSKVTALRLGKKRRNWELYDVVYWRSFGISVSTLEFFNVEPISYIFVNDQIHKADKYAYCFIEYKDGKETYKFYQPFNEKFKWINNHDDSVWQGWNQLPKKGYELIITKSLKDVMSLYEVAKIPAVSLQSENILPKQHVFQQLDNRFDTTYLLYDNDFDKETNWGKIFGNKIAKEFGLIDIWIPDKYKSKDFSDLVKNTNPEKALEILKHHMLPF